MLTFSGEAGGLNLLAQTRKESGWGLLFFTSGSSPRTMWSNRLKKSLCWLVFSLNVTPAELVATAMGILCFFRWWTSFSTPGGTHDHTKMRLKVYPEVYMRTNALVFHDVRLISEIKPSADMELLSRHYICFIFWFLLLISMVTRWPCRAVGGF